MKKILVYLLLLAASLPANRAVSSVLRQNAARIPGIGGVGQNGGSAPTLVQGDYTTGLSFTCAITFTVTAGDRLYFAFGGTVGTLTVADNQSDTFVVANPSATDGTNDTTAKSWYVQSAVGGSTTVTGTDTAQTFWQPCAMVEMGSTPAATTLDAIGEKDITTGMYPNLTLATSGATTQAAELAFGFFVTSQSSFPTWSAGSGWTLIPHNTGGNTPARQVMEYKVLSSTGTVTPTITGTTPTAEPGVSFVATFK